MLSDYRFIIIHGSGGYPGKNWFPWLAENLSRDGATTIVPAFPTPVNQQLDKWLDVFDKQVGKLDERTVLVGHSLGVLFIFRLLERSDTLIEAAFLVGGLANRKLGIEKFDSINTSFYEGDLDWSRIRSHSRAFYVYHSDNDPYIPLTLGLELAVNLETDLYIVHNAGHMNVDSGYTKFDRLLADIKRFIF
jgi:uncharacterized protein